uniref:CRAL-TRIO domain-containing protein n=1 Tax=Setaria digitata TaxID=48799 RepID=A0A915PC21_9BILA
MPAKFKLAPRASLNECSLIEQLRNKLTGQLPDGIPDDLNTDLNLLRWIRGFDGDFDKITKNFCTYVESRRAAGFDLKDLPEKFFELPHIKPFLPYIAASRLNDKLWLNERNAFLFIERAWCQPKELILRREKEQNSTAGPVQFIVFFDAASINLVDYLNPLSAQVKFWQIRSELWQDWYPAVVQKIYLINPPRLINAVWKLAGLFLKKENLELIEIIGNHEDLREDFPACFIPREYGGLKFWPERHLWKVLSCPINIPHYFGASSVTTTLNSRFMTKGNDCYIQDCICLLRSFLKRAF